jgi:uncharacterized membrane protein
MEFNNILGVFLVSLVPAIELRGAIPLGMAWGLPLWKVMVFALLGNIVVTIPLLCLFERFLHVLMKVPGIGGLLKWWFNGVGQRADIVRKWGFWGLVLFVGVPFPGTGVWSGSVAAVMLEMDRRDAFAAMVLGVLLAGAIVTLASLGIVQVWGAAVHS